MRLEVIIHIFNIMAHSKYMLEVNDNITNNPYLNLQCNEIVLCHVQSNIKV